MIIVSLILIILLLIAGWLLFRSLRKNRELEATSENYRRRALSLKVLLEETEQIQERQKQTETKIEEASDEVLLDRANRLFP